MMIDIFKCFSITSKHASVFLDKKLEQFELCSSHRIFIKMIVEKPGITRDALKNIAHVHPSNTTRTLDYLEEKGYIVKIQKEVDKRICMLYPTEKLKEVYDVLINSENEWIGIITEGMSEDELRIYKQFLSMSTELSVKYIHK